MLMKMALLDNIIKMSQWNVLKLSQPCLTTTTMATAMVTLSQKNYHDYSFIYQIHVYNGTIYVCTYIFISPFFFLASFPHLTSEISLKNKQTILGVVRTAHKHAIESFLKRQILCDVSFPIWIKMCIFIQFHTRMRSAYVFLFPTINVISVPKSAYIICEQTINLKMATTKKKKTIQLFSTWVYAAGSTCSKDTTHISIVNKYFRTHK